MHHIYAFKPGGFRLPGAARSRRTSGTTLVEVLVVIVILLIGILAVVQIFPRGFQLLTLSRKSAQATQLARQESERLKARADMLPNMVTAVNLAGESADATAPNELIPAGSTINGLGNLSVNGQSVGPWALHSGPNRFRRIVAETHRLPAPRAVGIGSNWYGGVLIPEFGPVDPATPVVVNGNDLVRSVGLPQGLQQRSGTDLFDVLDTSGDFEYFVEVQDASTVYLYLPTGPTSRVYRASGYALVDRGGGRFDKRLFENIDFATPATDRNGTITTQNRDGTTNTVRTNNHPLLRVNIAPAIAASLPAGQGTFASLLLDSLHTARGFRLLASADAFSADPFEYKVLNSNLGSLLFNPTGHSVFVPTGNGRQPLGVSLSYNVLDWRILREDFRINDTDLPQHRLPLGSIKVGGMAGPDGRPLTGISAIEPSSSEGGLSGIPASQDSKADHVALVDLDTGGIVCERNPANTSDTAQYVTVDKTLGLISFRDVDGSEAGTQGRLLLPDGSTRDVNLSGRALRALYMANNEWAVQVLKAASQYSTSPTLPGAGQFYVAGSNGSIGGRATSVYFPRADANQKVTVGTINYLARQGENLVARQIVGQDFVVRFRANDPLSYPSIDLRDVDPDAVEFDFGSATVGLLPVREVKGASVVVRVLWNPDTFRLTDDPQRNARAFDVWGRGWRRANVQTYIQRGSNIR